MSRTSTHSSSSTAASSERLATSTRVALPPPGQFRQGIGGGDIGFENSTQSGLDKSRNGCLATRRLLAHALHDGGVNVQFRLHMENHMEGMAICQVQDVCSMSGIRQPGPSDSPKPRGEAARSVRPSVAPAGAPKRGLDLGVPPPP